MSAIAITAAKGGVGVSLIAVNLALTLQETETCLLLDLHGPCQVDDLLLDLEPGRAWEDLLPVSAELKSAHLDQALTNHSSGLRFLAGSIEHWRTAAPQQVVNLLCALQQHFHWLVLDCPKGFHPWTQVALSVCGIGLLVATPDLPTLRACSRFLKLLNPTVRSKMGLILNQVGERPPVRAAQIAEQLNCPLLLELPVDQRTIGEQVHFGRIASSNGNSSFRNALYQLTETLHARCGESLTQPPASRV